MTALIVLATKINGVFRSVDHALKHNNRGIILYYFGTDFANTISDTFGSGLDFGLISSTLSSLSSSELLSSSESSSDDSCLLSLTIFAFSSSFVLPENFASVSSKSLSDSDSSSSSDDEVLASELSSSLSLSLSLSPASSLSSSLSSSLESVSSTTFTTR
jgi:hypothetical protein